MSERTHGEARYAIVPVELLKKIMVKLEEDCDSCDHCGSCELARYVRREIADAPYDEENCIL